MDDINQVIGTNGFYQKVMALYVVSSSVICLVLMVAYPLLYATPKFLCLEMDQTLNLGQRVCSIHELCIPEKYEYTKSEDSFINLAYDYDLYCDKRYLIKITGSTYYIGGIAGFLILSPVPDRLGRRSVALAMIGLFIFLYSGMLLTPPYIVIIIIHFIAGFLIFNLGISAIYNSEVFSQHTAGLIMSARNSVYPCLGVLFSLLFIYINSWKFMILCMLIYNVIIYYLASKYMVESPKWLKSKGRFKEYLEAVREIASINGRSEELESYLKENPSVVDLGTTETIRLSVASINNMKKKTYSFFDILRLKSQQMKIAYLSYYSLYLGFIFTVIFSNLSVLGDNFMVVGILLFIIQAMGTLTSGIFSTCFGRVFVLKLYAATTFVCFMGQQFFGDIHLLKIIFIFSGSYGVSGAFNAFSIYTPEVLPTKIRGTAVGNLTLVSRVGSFLVPSFIDLIPFPNIVFGIICFLAYLSACALPETLNNPIEDFIPEEIEIETTKLI